MTKLTTSDIGNSHMSKRSHNVPPLCEKEKKTHLFSKKQKQKQERTYAQVAKNYKFSICELVNGKENSC